MIKVIYASKYKTIFSSMKFPFSTFAFPPLPRVTCVHCLNIFIWGVCWGRDCGYGYHICTPHALEYMLPLNMLFFNLLIFTNYFITDTIILVPIFFVMALY